MVEPGPASDGRMAPAEPVSYGGRLPCPREAAVEVPIGHRVIVASELFIGRFPGRPRPELERFASYLRTVEGPGLVVVAGNLFDLLYPRHKASISDLVTEHKYFFDELRHLVDDRGFSICIVPGSRDAALAYDDDLRRQLAEATGARFALTFRLLIETTTGRSEVRVSSGRELDERSSPMDPYSPSDTPFVHHLVGEIVPNIASKAPWLDGIDLAIDSGAISRFVGSRLFYRRAMRYLPLVIVPLLVAFLIKLPFILALPPLSHLRARVFSAAPLIQAAGIATVVDALVVLILTTWVARRIYTGLVEDLRPGVGGAAGANIAARVAAMEELEKGSFGVISGNSLRAELADLTNGFFAVAGSISSCYREKPARLGLPSVFVPLMQCTWVELQPGAKIRVRLYSQSEERPAESLVERIFSVGTMDNTHGLRILASYPDGQDYAEADDRPGRHQRARRLAAAAVFMVGFIDLVSALTPPLRGRLGFLREFLPIAVSETANALTAMGAVGLLALASGLRRGQRLAYLLTLVLTVISVATNLLKGGDFEESALLVIVLIYLLANRGAFSAPSNRTPFARGLLWIPIGWLLILVGGTITLQLDLLFFERHSGLGLGTSFMAVLERMIGISSITLPSVIDDFLSPALGYASLALFALLIFRAFRPVVEAGIGRIHLPGRASLAPAEIVRRYSSSTLDYFALRDDKSFYVAYDTVIAYAVIGSVALVSPDPIGPEATARQAWKEFMRFASSKGWALSVLGAGDKWLPVYAADGLHSMYIGDEAVVEVEDFRLDGKRNKSLRQAVNRMRNYGYRVEFLDPSKVAEPLRSELLDVLTRSRRGGVERGFSMTLGRFLDPRDTGLMLTVCYGPEGSVVGFCQWVPSPGINGFSLDLMRRDLGDHPNGLTDLMVVATIKHLRETGYSALSLNFATMRAVIAGEAEENVQARLERWFLRRLSDTMQIESLWRFNSKFNPKWLPRYLVFDTPENLAQVAMAIARAESFWELPVIGKFLVPKS